ncbi:MAG: PspC domain-containing protein [Lentisphaeria bacterium]|nr:PspC domain-containing protein [Candidatus Neomarinimicrobiota bacterium]MCF7842097.1 PspC domain-containing protein [Lentisphaeria bacterium]
MKKLYKSSTNKVFDGVCGGIGEYFAIDPVIIRILWMLLVVFGGTGFIAYIIAMFIIPRESEVESTDVPEEEVVEPEVETPHHTGRLFGSRFWGVLLIVIGGLMLLRYIDPVWSIFSVMGRFMVSIIWPVALILLGIYLVMHHRADGHFITGWFKPEGKLTRSKTDRRIAGVCGGLGTYLGIDGNIVRILWVMGSLTSMGFGILAYIIMAIFVPEET